MSKVASCRPPRWRQSRSRRPTCSLYLLNLTDKRGIDLVAVARQKLLINAGKYPAERSRGTSKKYTEL